MSELNITDIELSFKLNEDQFAELLPTTEINSECVLAVDYGNGIYKQLKGNLYINIHCKYKKPKKEKNINILKLMKFYQIVV